MDQFTIGWSTAADHGAIATIAALDGAVPPGRPVLAAGVGGRLVAFVTEDGTVVADPFVPTADAGELLRARRAQLARAPRGGRRLRLATRPRSA